MPRAGSGDLHVTWRDSEYFYPAGGFASESSLSTEVCTESPALAKTLALRLRITPHLKGYLDNTSGVLRNRT